MGLDPLVAALLAQLDAGPVASMPLEEVRTNLDMLTRIGFAIGAPMAEVREIAIPGEAEIPARLYLPEGERLPRLTLFFHGGGFVLGSLGGYDGLVRYLARATSAPVLSVGYRLAPEHRFPAAVNDALAAVDFAIGNLGELGGADRLGVAGDSAGGNLAAVAALHARELDIELAGQLLLYPACDFTRTYPSMSEFATGYFLTLEDLVWFGSCYLGDDGQAGDWRVSPALASDHANLAPAVVGVAGYDPLRDQGIRYSELLAAAGVGVELRRYDGMIHGFAALSGLVPAAKSAFDELIGLYRELLSS